jgi:DNA-binding protein HU-beta
MQIFGMSFVISKMKAGHKTLTGETVNTNEIVKILSERLNKPQTEIRPLLDSTLKVLKSQFGKQKAITFTNFGTFIVRKREKRKSYNPFKEFYVMLPPKLALAFRPSASLKENMPKRRKG